MNDGWILVKEVVEQKDLKLYTSVTATITICQRPNQLCVSTVSASFI